MVTSLVFGTLLVTAGFVLVSVDVLNDVDFVVCLLVLVLGLVLV